MLGRLKAACIYNNIALHVNQAFTESGVFILFDLLLVKEAKDFSSSLLASSLFVCHNSVRCRKDEVTKLPGWQQVHDPFLNFVIWHVETRGNHTTLIETTIQLDDNLAGAVIIDNFEFANVSCVL